MISIINLFFRSNYQDDIDCPVCRSKVQFPRGVLSKLPKNHLLMDLMESVGLKDRCLNQKQIHTILTDVSYFVSEFKVYLTLRLVFTKHLTVVLFRLNRGDIRLDFQLNQQMIWNQGHLKNHLLKKKLLLKIAAKKVIFLQAVKMSQTIPIAQILKLVLSQKSIQLIPTKAFSVDFRSILGTL